MRSGNEQKGRSFGLVDHKIAEADFFLSKIARCKANFFEARYYVSARSMTFALQSVLRNIDGFEAWYIKRQKDLRNDPLVSFFNEFRRVNQHIGDVNGGSGGPNTPYKLWFTPTDDIPEVPREDVITSCRKYMLTIVALVYDCYIDFGPYIDAHQRYTSQYFESVGKTIEDAEEEIGLPRGWTDIGDPSTMPYKWQMLRANVTGCEINDIFYKYLRKITPQPERVA